MPNRKPITYARYEALIDHRVTQWLRCDLAYLNAANAEEQSAREEQIEDAVIRDIDAEYELTDS